MSDWEQVKQNYESLIQNNPLPIIILDKNMNVIHWNEAAENMFGWKLNEVIGKPYPIIPDFEKEKFEKAFAQVLNGQLIMGLEGKRKRKDGSLLDTSVFPLPWFDSSGKIAGYVAIIRDITEIKKMEKELEHQKDKIERIAYSDYLTGIPNRLLFEMQLEKNLHKAKMNQSLLALMILNLDDFKFINDTLGPKIGDKLLKDVAIRLTRARMLDDFVARISGDEFAIIITNINNMEEINDICQQYINIFQWPFIIDGYEIFLTTTAGICLYPYGAESVYTFIQNADLALARAKEIGKNNIEIFSPTMNVGAYKKFTLQNDLRKAVQENEIVVVYQPKVSSETYTIIGAEALARWKHPQWGMISPMEFILLAEKTGFIHTIGNQVLLEACKQNKKWQEEGFPPIKVSVNISPIQLLHPDFVNHVENVLFSTGLSPQWLELEITETAWLKNESEMIAKIEQLRSLGIGIAIDDYGTGYSSLSYLKKLRPDTVKIDRSFIQEIPNDLENTEIVTAVINLAKKLNVKVVAEGVETKEQASYLCNLHCNELQGYYFSKPIPADEFKLLLKKGICSPEAALQKTVKPVQNRRKFFRIALERPLIGEMTITSIAGKSVQLGMTKILIEDIGPGGLRFLSNIKLPARKDLILKIKTVILGQEVEVNGILVWMKEKDNIQQYGLQFIISENERTILTSILNQFQSKLRNSGVLTTCSFLTTSIQKFFM